MYMTSYMIYVIRYITSYIFVFIGSKTDVSVSYFFFPTLKQNERRKDTKLI